MMRGRARQAARWGVIALALIGAGPCAVCPGGRLDGEVAPEPVGDWRFLGDQAACAIEVRPDEPYSVRATCLQHGGELYVSSMLAPRKRWPAMVVADDRVRVKIGDRVYERRAVRVTDTAQRVEVLGGSVEDPPSESEWLWRLDPR